MIASMFIVGMLTSMLAAAGKMQDHGKPFLVDIMIYDEQSEPNLVIEIWSNREHVVRAIGPGELIDFRCSIRSYSCASEYPGCEVIPTPLQATTCY